MDPALQEIEEDVQFSHGYALAFLQGRSEGLDHAGTRIRNRQEEIRSRVAAFALGARLPKISVSFDAEGAAVSPLSKEDATTFHQLYSERLETIAEAVQQAAVAADQTPALPRPQFLEEGLAGLAEITGDMSGWTDDQRGEYEAYAASSQAHFDAAASSIAILEPHHRRWDLENRQHEFASVADPAQRRYYDFMRRPDRDFDAEARPARDVK